MKIIFVICCSLLFSFANGADCQFQPKAFSFSGNQVGAVDSSTLEINLLNLKSGAKKVLTSPNLPLSNLFFINKGQSAVGVFSHPFYQKWNFSDQSTVKFSNDVNLSSQNHRTMVSNNNRYLISTFLAPLSGRGAIQVVDMEAGQLVFSDSSFGWQKNSRANFR